jgi:site-specific DNA-methyltransferase (adenine-specific)
MSQPRFQLTQGDAVAWLKTVPAASVDLVITDPPYESLEKHRAIGTTTRLKHSKASSNDWFSIFPNTRFPELFAEVFRVLKKDTHFYLFCDPETMFVAKPLAEQAGFKFWKPLIWDKQKIGMGYHYRARYECAHSSSVHERATTPPRRSSSFSEQRSSTCHRWRRGATSATGC